MPARSIRSPPARCRSRSARRPRPSATSWTAARSTASPSAGARRRRPTTPRARSPRPPTCARRDADIRAVLPEFTGEIMQVPPRFSAIKIAGERAYDLAREGEAVELEPREIVIHRLELRRVPRRRSCRLPGGVRQGRLCAGACARHGPAARHARPCCGAAPPGRRPVRRGRHDFAGKAGGVAP